MKPAAAALNPARRCDTVRAMPNPSPPAEQSSIAEFERSLSELEQIVSKLEHGELSLDESLSTFERGIALYRDCKTALDAAELKVKQLTDPLRPDGSVPFDPEA